jgi:hypothetical protein
MADPRTQLPPGFEIDPIQALPPGFEVDQPAQDPGIVALPEGFQPDEDTWGETGLKALQNAPALFKQSVAGLAQKTAEQPITSAMPFSLGPLGDVANKLSTMGRDWLSKQFGLEPAQGEQWAADLYRSAAEDLAENAPNIDPESLKGYAYDAATSLIQMMPGVVSALLTKKPSVGAATMGGQVAGQQYAESRAEGRTPEQANVDAVAMGLAEGVPEMLPLGILMKPGGKFLSRIFKTAGAEGATEVLTQAIQDGYSAGVLKEDMTWGQAWENMKRAGILGAFVGGTFAAGTHPFVRSETTAPPPTGGAQPAGDAAAAAEIPISAPVEPSPAAAAAPTGPWGDRAAAPAEPAAIDVGQVVGLKRKAGAPQRATIEGVQDGYVFWRDEDGNQQADTVAEFRRDVTAAPPPKRLEAAPQPGDMGPEPPPPDVGDINDFDPFPVQEPRRTRPQQPTAAPALALPDTARISALERQARSWEVSAAEAEERATRGEPGARTPEEIAAMRRSAQAAATEAADLRRRLEPSRASQDVTAATPEQMAARGLGPLSSRLPAASEATTGPQQFKVRPKPQTRVGPVQEQLGPVPGSEAEKPQVLPPLPTAEPVSWQQRLRQQVRERKASLNDPIAIARSLSRQTKQQVSAQDVQAELRSIAAQPKSPIEIMRGTLKKDRKTGQMVQSARAGKYRYTPGPMKRPMTLTELIISEGGIRMPTPAGPRSTFYGEVKERGLDAVFKLGKGMGKLFRPDARMSIEDAADRALSYGYGIEGGVSPDGDVTYPDIDKFLNMLEDERAGRRRHYDPREQYEEEPDGPDRPRTPAERKRDAIHQLAALGFEPRGKTFEELEAQLDQILDVIGASDPVDALDLAIETERAIVDAMDPAAQAALRREATSDYPTEYSDEWFAQELADAPAAHAEADAVDQAGDRGTEPAAEGQKPVAGRLEDGTQDADRIAEETLRLESEESTRIGENRYLTSIFERLAEGLDIAKKHDLAAQWVTTMGKRTGNEYAVALSQNGTVVEAWTSDSPRAVAFGRSLTADLTSAGPRITLHHNHPKAGPLSTGDMQILRCPGTGWIVAHTTSGGFSAARLSDRFRISPKNTSIEKTSNVVDWAIRRAHAMSLQLNRKHFLAGRLKYELWEVSETAWRALHRAGLIDYLSSIPPSDTILPEIDAVSSSLIEDLKTHGYELTDADRHRGSTAVFSADQGLAEVSRRPGEDAEGRISQEPDRADRQDDRPQEGRDEIPADRSGTAVPEGLSAPETGGVLARLMRDESGALTLPEWGKIRAFFGLKGDAPAVARAGNNVQIGHPDTVQALSKLGRYLRSAVSLAAIDRPSSVYWNAILRQDHTRAQLERAAIAQTKPYLALDQQQRDRVNKVLEYDRLYGIERSDTGRTVVVKIPDRKPPFGAGKPELSRPGEVIALDQVETEALHSLRQFFDERLLQMGEAVARERGYRGAFNKASIQKEIDTAEHPRERRRAANAMEVWNQTQEMRRTGYVPFQRYGDTFIHIKPKLPEGNVPETAWFELVDTKSIFDTIYSRPGGKPRRAVQDRLAELEKRFPHDKFEYQTGLATPKAVANLNIPALERAFTALNLKPGTDTQGILDDLMHQVFEARKAGLRKQAQNVPGYSLDFERAITDYVRQTSAIIARMSHRQDVDSAYDAIQAHPSKEVRDYWAKHKQHMEDEGGDFAGLRKFGFFMFLWGSPAAAAVNLTQTPLVTQMQLSTWAGARAPGLAHQAMLEGMGAISVGRNGLELDFSKLGKTDAERAMLKELQAEGRFDPAIAEDLAGSNLSTRRAVRPHLTKLQRAYEIGASMFNATETVNRVAAALAYFRAAQNPQLRDKMRQVYSRDENFKEMVVNAGMNPTDIARFGVDETQFIGGKINRAPVMRDWGAVLLQFKTYIANYLRLIHKNMTRMGPQGKIVGSTMLIALMMIGGLLGAPGAEDVLNAADAIGKMATGIDPNLEYQLRSFLADVGFGEYGAEIMTRGIGRDIFGVDIGGRLGMGNIFPDNSLTSLAPVVTGTIGAAAEASDRIKSGQPIGALSALSGMAVGKGGRDLIKGFAAYPAEGISTKRGNFTVLPEDVTLGEMVTRAIGFQPTKATRASERQYQQSRIANATRDARTAMLTHIARLVVMQQRAAQRGDKESATEYGRDIEAVFEDNMAQLIDPSIPDWQKIKPPSRQAIKQRVLTLVQPEVAALKRAGKLSREEMSDMPYVEP